MMITHHTQLLNALIEKYNLKSYLEIGVQNPANNFDKINAFTKVGVEPALKSFIKQQRIDENGDISYSIITQRTSDDFFKSGMNCGNPDQNVFIIKFDLIFIDGLHHADQVKRDFENSLKCLNDSGFIVIHDVLPENEQGTKVPRETKVWWGDVYKFAMTMHDYGLEFKTFNIDNGCMVVSKTPIIRPVHPGNIKYDWNTYNLYKKSLLRIVDEVVI